jgi:hypothetical protein
MKKLLLASLATLVSTAAVADVQWYGFLKGDVTRADQMDSDQNATYATEKGAEYSNYNKQTHSVMSFRDSRIGAKLDNGSKVSGVLELDFDGESAGDTDGITNSTALQWRQANITYATGNGNFHFGKGYSAFSALDQHTMQVNRVGLYQGKTGFIGDYLGYKHNFGDLGTTLQFGGSDADDTKTDRRANKISNPSTTLRLDYSWMDHNFGFAYAMASKNLKKSDTTTSTTADDFGKDADVTAMKLFGDMNFGATNVRFEYTQGTNAVGTGWLSKATLDDILPALLASSTESFKDVEETAMWVSANHKMGMSNIWVRSGVSEITNIDKAGSTSNRINDGRVVKNAVSGIGYSREIDKNFTVYGEYSMITTGRVKDAGLSTEKVNSDDGTTIDLGMMYKF